MTENNINRALKVIFLEIYWVLINDRIRNNRIINEH